MALSGDHNGSATFDRMPNELKLMFAKELELADVNALARTSRAANQLLTRYMYCRAKNLRTRKGRPFFFVAVDRGNLRAVKQFIEAGAEVNMRDNTSQTALDSEYYECIETAQLAVNNGVKASAVDQIGCTPLHRVAAGKRRNEAMARLLIDAGADISATCRYMGTVLHTAASLGTASMVRLLLDRGVVVAKTDRDCGTPLHGAATCGTAATIRLLLDAGLDIEATNVFGRTPLHCAAQFGKAKTLKALLRSGANVMATDHLESTPLHLAVGFRGTEAIAQRLLDLGAADPGLLAWAKQDARYTPGDPLGDRILTFVVDPMVPSSLVGTGGDLIVELLLDAGADIWATNSYNICPVHWAIFRAQNPIRN